MADSEISYDHAGLKVNNVLFTLKEKVSSQGSNLLLICEMGEIPQKNQVLVLSRLLEMNFHFFSESSSVFCGIDPETQRVNLCVSLPLPEITPQSTVGLLMQLASMVDLWRKDCFLNKLSSAASPASPYHETSVRTDLHTFPAGRNFYER